MSFTFRPATREGVGLLIGLAGGTGSGKTYSAMLLARGIARGIAGDKPFAVIDTEAGRAKHYAGEFRFDHGDLIPPFRPDTYAEAIAAADAAGYPVIVVDSMSHEHAGDGGLLDWHNQELDRMAGSDWKKRESLTFTAWVQPKQAHKRMVSRLLQVRAHLILCFRAEEKIEIVKDEKGKTVVRPKVGLAGLDGWHPIAEKTLPYELTLSFLLTAGQPGVPRPIKLQEQHKPFFPLDAPISEQAGRSLAGWAAGGNSSGAPSPPEGQDGVAVSAAPDQSASGGDGDSGALTPPAAADKSPATLDLVERLLVLAPSIDKAQDSIDAHYAKHGDGDAHRTWLRRCIAKLEADSEPETSEYGRMAAEAIAKRGGRHDHYG